MSGKGNRYDNWVVDAFFETLKSELVWRTVSESRTEAKEAIGRYIDGFYNPMQRHSTLDYVSLVQFERLAGCLQNSFPLKRRKSTDGLASEFGDGGGVAGVGTHALRFVDLREVNRPARYLLAAHLKAAKMAGRSTAPTNAHITISPFPFR
jgi:hypothetical protein